MLPHGLLYPLNWEIHKASAFIYVPLRQTLVWIVVQGGESEAKKGGNENV